MRANRSITIVGIIFLLWNLMGVAAFITQYNADLTELAKVDPVAARIFAAMPGWVWIAYAIAVGAGVAGAIALLSRKAVAATLFLVGIIAVLVQFGYTFLGTDLLAAKGATTAIFPAVIVAIAIIELLYARSLVAKGALR